MRYLIYRSCRLVTVMQNPQRQFRDFSPLDGLHNTIEDFNRAAPIQPSKSPPNLESKIFDDDATPVCRYIRTTDRYRPRSPSQHHSYPAI